MTKKHKKDVALIQKLIGNQFETHEDMQNELVRRSAILDFLALYQEARKDGVVERVKHIIHAKDFLKFKPQYLEVYITRLLGRCLRAHIEGHQVVEKERNTFRYNLDIRRSQHAALAQIFDMQSIVQLSWPWHLSTYYMYGRNNRANERYNDNPQLYWRTRGLVDPSEVDALYAAWNQFKARVDALERVNMGLNMSSRLSVNYGNPGYIGRQRWYRSYNHASYYAYEAYRDFKEWVVIANEFLENDQPFNVLRILETHDQSDDSQIEDLLKQNAEREAQFLRERALEMARQRSAENSIDFPPEEEEAVGHEPEVEEGTTGNTLKDRFLAKLRERGLME